MPLELGVISRKSSLADASISPETGDADMQSLSGRRWLEAGFKLFERALSVNNDARLTGQLVWNIETFR